MLRDQTYLPPYSFSYGSDMTHITDVTSELESQFLIKHRKTRKSGVSEAKRPIELDESRTALTV